jgi:hypothetical protein
LAHAPSAVPEVSVSRPPFKEQIDPDIPAAGGRLIGVIMGPLSQTVTGPVITVSGILSSDRVICVSIQHVNGSYSGGFTVKNPGRGNTLRFRMPSRLIQGLGAKTAALAILAQASAGPTCSSKDPILPAAWGQRLIAGAGFALVNDHQADITRSRIGAQRIQKCFPVAPLVGTGVHSRSYQMACSIDDTGPCASEVQLTIQFIESGDQAEISPKIRRAC